MLRTMVVSVLALILGISCAHHPKGTPQELEKAYRAAIEDARVAKPSEIVNDLVTLAPWNTDLLRSDQGEVRVVSWTNWNGYDELAGKRISLARPVWVTVVPYLKNFCRECGLKGEALDMRLRQRLGLPPGAAKNRFVEFWVDPADLFRPSPDPEITDREAELDFPVSTRFVTVSEGHRKWFNNQKKSSYSDQGYPWTRLGYTYDWGAKDHVGESEFVIREGANVLVQGVTFTEGYCKKK